jgi:hypothetical protein
MLWGLQQVVQHQQVEDHQEVDQAVVQTQAVQGGMKNGKTNQRHS